MLRTPVPRSFALGALIALIAVTTLAGGLATAWAQTPTIEVTPAAAQPGQQITISGFGFQDGETVTVDFGGATIASAVADGEGAFQGTGTIPADIPPGTHPIDVTGDRGSQFALIYEVVTSAPTPTPTPAPTAPPATGPEARVLPESGAAPGEIVTVTGGGFGPGESVTVSLDGTDLATVGATIAGAFLANVAIPVTTPAGSHAVQVTGDRGQQITVDYVVLAPPTPTPAPTSEPTPAPTATASPTSGDATATPVPGDGTPGAPSGGETSGGGGSANRGEFPTLLVGALAAAGGLFAGLYLLWVRRTFA